MGKKSLLFIRKSAIYQKLKSYYVEVRPIVRYYFNMRKSDKLLGKSPIFIYNHIPKCGGTSFLVLLREFFNLIDDYPPQNFYFKKEELWDKEMFEYIENPPNYLSVKPFQILVGHYFSSNLSIIKRYPGVYQNSRVKLITFLREPLSYRISLFSYGLIKNHIYSNGFSLEEFLLKDRNSIASFLQCDYNNYQNVLDNYFFIGIMEEYNDSIKVLSNKLNIKLNRSIPHLNKSNSSRYNKSLTIPLIKQFKKINELDYLIYTYSLQLLSDYLKDNKMKGNFVD